MKQIFFIFFAAFCFVCGAQNSNAAFFSTPRDTTIRNSDGSSFRTKISDVADDKKIVGWNYYPRTNDLFFELENKQAFATKKSYRKILSVVNPADLSVKWQKEVRDMDNSVISSGDLLFLRIRKQTFLLDKTNGAELWKIKRNLYFALPEEKIGFFYPGRESSSNLWAVNLTSGKKIWETNQPRRFGWDDAYLYDPQTLLIASEGISLYNIYNGAKQQYHAKTSYSDASKIFFGNLAGVLVESILGALLDSEVSFYPYEHGKNISSNIMSNVSIDGGGDFYIASADKISRVSPKGTVVWSCKLPKKETSKSSIFLSGGNVYLVNRGYALCNGNPALMGKAFLASYDMETGEQRYLETLALSRETVDNFQVIGNTLFVITGNNIRSYDLPTGKMTNATSIEGRDSFLNPRFVEEGVFVRTQRGRMVDVLEAHPSQIHILKGDGSLVSMDENLASLNFYKKEDVFKSYLRVNGFLFLEQGGRTFVLRDGKPVAELPFEAEGFVSSDNKFYHIQKNHSKIWEVDLNGLD